MLSLLRGVGMKKKNIIITIIILIIITTIFFILINNNQNNNKRLIELTYDEIIEKTNNKDDFILVFTHSTCSHCVTYKPKLKEIANDYNIYVYYINLDSDTIKDRNKFLKEFNLSGATPITIFIKDGKEVSLLNRLEGDLPTKKVVERFKKMGFIKE